jgi:hypothetical protein
MASVNPAAVCLHQPDHDAGAAVTPPLPFREHGVRLADPGCRTEVDPQLTARHGQDLPA